MTEPIKYWRCPNCGQTHFGDDPPDTCDFCEDFTTWQPITVAASKPFHTRKPTHPPQQLDLFSDPSSDD